MSSAQRGGERKGDGGVSRRHRRLAGERAIAVGVEALLRPRASEGVLADLHREPGQRQRRRQAAARPGDTGPCRGQPGRQQPDVTVPYTSGWPKCRTTEATLSAPVPLLCWHSAEPDGRAASARTGRPPRPRRATSGCRRGAKPSRRRAPRAACPAPATGWTSRPGQRAGRAAGGTYGPCPASGRRGVARRPAGGYLRSFVSRDLSSGEQMNRRLEPASRCWRWRPAATTSTSPNVRPGRPGAAGPVRPLRRRAGRGGGDRAASTAKPPRADSPEALTKQADAAMAYARTLPDVADHRRRPAGPPADHPASRAAGGSAWPRSRTARAGRRRRARRTGGRRRDQAMARRGARASRPAERSRPAIYRTATP